MNFALDDRLDSGFDSDQNKMSNLNGELRQPKQTEGNTSVELTIGVADENHATLSAENEPNRTDYASRLLKKPSELQKKIEKQSLRKPHTGVVSHQPQSKSSGVVSRSRLFVPTKSDVSSGAISDTQPLVIIDMDESSEDEFASPRLSKLAQREIAQQLMKDGYNLDLEPDDEDLDLIPPRPLNERCICCNAQVNCSIQ